jgi:hypothetical protein
MNLERIVLDYRARPYALHEIILGDEFAGCLNQYLDDLERAAADGDQVSPHAQLTAREIDLPLATLVYWGSVLCRLHAAPLLRFLRLVQKPASRKQSPESHATADVPQTATSAIEFSQQMSGRDQIGGLHPFGKASQNRLEQGPQFGGADRAAPQANHAHRRPQLQ